MVAISVVMPLYNREDSVGRAIDSVLAQDFAAFEIVVVDDGSDDDGPQIVERYRDPRIRLIRQPARGGANVARNRGIRASAAPIIAFLDSDDEYLPGRLRHVADTFARRPDLSGMLDGYHRPPKRAGGASRIYANTALDDPDEILRGLFLRRIHKATSGIAISRQAAERSGMFDEALKRRQDYDFLIRLIRSGPFVVTGQATWIKHHGRQAISDDNAAFVPALFAFLDRHPDYFDNTQFRRGFDLDVARHSWRLVKTRDWNVLRRDLAALRRRIGVGSTVRSLASGFVELARWRREERLSSPQIASAGTAGAVRSDA